MATREIKPPAGLGPRNDRERLVTLEGQGFPHGWLPELSCFEPRVLDKLREFPGTIIVRFFRKHEVICYQDDPGYTAFYLLKKDETQKLTQSGRLLPIGMLEDWPTQAVAAVRRRSYGSAG